MIYDSVNLHFWCFEIFPRILYSDKYMLYMSSLFLFWSRGVGKPDGSLCPPENLLCVVTLSFLPLGMLGQHETYT